MSEREELERAMLEQETRDRLSPYQAPTWKPLAEELGEIEEVLVSREGPAGFVEATRPPAPAIGVELDVVDFPEPEARRSPLFAARGSSRMRSRPFDQEVDGGIEASS